MSDEQTLTRIAHLFDSCDWPSHRWSSWENRTISALIEAGYLEEVAQPPTLRLTAKAADILHGNEFRAFGR